MAEVLELAGAAADEPFAGGESFADRVERKTEELTAAFESRYGHDLNDPTTWAKFLADNS